MITQEDTRGRNLNENGCEKTPQTLQVRQCLKGGGARQEFYLIYQRLRERA